MLLSLRETLPPDVFNVKVQYFRRSQGPDISETDVEGVLLTNSSDVDDYEPSVASLRVSRKVKRNTRIIKATPKEVRRLRWATRVLPGGKRRGQAHREPACRRPEACTHHRALDES